MILIIRVRTDIDNRRKSPEYSSRDQVLTHLEDKLKVLENDNYEYLNRLAADGIKIQSLHKELREKEDLFISREKELFDKISYLNEEIKLMKNDYSNRNIASLEKSMKKEEYLYLIYIIVIIT